jgi:hypothetical protein
MIKTLALGALAAVLATGVQAQNVDTVSGCPLDANGRCAGEWCKTHTCWEVVDSAGDSHVGPPSNILKSCEPGYTLVVVGSHDMCAPAWLLEQPK